MINNLSGLPYIPVSGKGAESQSRTDLQKAAEGFETLFTHQLLQELQKDLQGNSMFGDGVEGNTLGAMAEWELASHMAKSLDLGILRQLELTMTAEGKANES
ncbi:hypothetical protein HUU59_00330 [bacterium]|nr:hypothetical protein [bacterium]